ncbi:MAG: hypothetical protein AAGJ83_01930, partial [Planctomycetota bacterium]
MVAVSMNAKPNRKRKNRRRKTRRENDASGNSDGQVLESVASLLQRLGRPKTEVASLLERRFRTAVHDEFARGVFLSEVNLDHWCVMKDGRLRLSERSEVKRETSVDRGMVDRQVDRLVEQFRNQLDAAAVRQRVNAKPRVNAQPLDEPRRNQVDETAPMENSQPPRSENHPPMKKTARNPDRESLSWQSRAMRARPPKSAGLSAAALEQQIIEEDDDSRFSDAQNRMRADLAAMFTDSLAEKFGEQVRFAPTFDDGAERRTTQSIPQDRPFNWNLVFGVVTAAVVLVMIGIGVYISSQRNKQASLRLGESGFATTTQMTTRPQGDSSADGLPAREIPDGGRLNPFTDLEESAENLDSPRVKLFGSRDSVREFDDAAMMSSDTKVSRFDVTDDPDLELDLPVRERKKAYTPIDPMDDLLGALDAIESDFDEASKIEETLIKNPMIDAENADLRPDDVFSEAESQTPVTDLVLEEVPSDPVGETDDIVEQVKGTRAAQANFIELPTITAQSRTLRSSLPFAPISELQFPIRQSFEIRKTASSAGQYVISKLGGENDIAGLELSQLNQRFGWSENARTSDRNVLLHGRILNQNGDVIYLRRSIEADAIPLELALAKKKTSWGLGAGVLESVTDIRVDWMVPESLNLTWIEPFNVSRGRGTAIATVEPVEGDSVAIGVKLFVELNRSAITLRP